MSPHPGGFFRAMSNPTKTDLDRCLANLIRGNQYLDELADAWAGAGGICCPGCMFGALWTQVVGRQQSRADLLYGKGLLTEAQRRNWDLVR